MKRKIGQVFWIVLLVCCLLPTIALAKNKTTSKTPAKNWKVVVAQQKLQILGYEPGLADGKLNKTTADELKKFQKQNKLKANGKLDDKTYQKLTWEAFKKEGIKNLKGQDVIKTASKYKGVPYRFGGTTPKGFDCSGYVQYVFAAHKIKVPRTADVQVQDGIFVTKKQLKKGDLVFFSTYEPGASHVGIYAGNGMFWTASSSRGVVLDALDSDYWKKHYYGARRVLVNNGEAA